MLCESCQKRAATVHFTQVVNNTKVEKYLCEQCAKDKKQFTISSPMSLNDFFSGFMGFVSDERRALQDLQEIQCQQCGMRYEEFQKLGKLGCGNCYEVFGERLNPLIKRVHGTLQHNGKVPEKVSKSIKASQEVEKLKGLLNDAIRREEYEKAAELRDKIKSMEAGMG